MKYVAFLLLGVLIGIGSMIYIDNSQPSPLEPTDPSRILTPTAVVISAKTVITQLKSVSKLVTAEAQIDTLTELENNEQYITWRSGFTVIDYVLTSFNTNLGRRYIKIQGSGIVKAGVDLSKIDDEIDIIFSDNNQTVTIELPPSEQLGNAEIDFTRTYPLAVEQGFLISKNDFTITEQGYAKVGEQLNMKVCDSNALQFAADRAKENVQQLVRAFNPSLKNVIVNGAAGNCGQ
jgi:hypothetical protein